LSNSPSDPGASARPLPLTSRGHAAAPAGRRPEGWAGSGGVSHVVASHAIVVSVTVTIMM
jgi:hypothetical protein